MSTLPGQIDDHGCEPEHASAPILTNAATTGTTNAALPPIDAKASLASPHLPASGEEAHALLPTAETAVPQGENSLSPAENEPSRSEGKPSLSPSEHESIPDDGLSRPSTEVPELPSSEQSDERQPQGDPLRGRGNVATRDVEIPRSDSGLSLSSSPEDVEDAPAAPNSSSTVEAATQDDNITQDTPETANGDDATLQDPVALASVSSCDGTANSATLVPGLGTIAPLSRRARHQRRRKSRYVRHALRERRQTFRVQAFSSILLMLLLVSISVPLVISISYGIRLYQTYDTLRTHAYSGIDHLLDLKQLFLADKHTGTTSSSKNTGSLLDSAKLLRARNDLNSAHEDFVQLQFQLDHSDFIATALQWFPRYRPTFTTARSAIQIGIDATAIGQQVVAAGQTIAPRFSGPLLSDSSSPLILPSDLTLLQSTLNHVQPLLNDIMVQNRTLSLSSLPISTTQLTQVKHYLDLLPQVMTAISSYQGYTSLVAWLLGVDQPRTFLVQPMDRAELRGTGGFTGQYGELHINGGRVAPFSLTNIALLEYATNSPTYGNLAPEAYRSWWPFANWGLRDSNLSADFPTSANLAIERYKAEVNHQVDGVITFTPTALEHVLQVTGPISILDYQETITAQNLEAKLHFYQLDHAGIIKEKAIAHVSGDEEARKQFTSAVAHTIMDHFRHASLSELLNVSPRLLGDLQTRELQVYVTNPEIESLLMQFHYAGQMDRSTTHDGLYVVQMNVSVNKGSQYVQTTMHDTVTLDAQGGATHALHMHFVYNEAGPVYGQDTYYDYVRIYVPPTAHYLSGNGFNPTGDEPYCNTWQSTNGIGTVEGGGPPTNQQSDEPQRAMFAGYVVIPKNCSASIDVSWYVPPAPSSPYSLLFQRQAGTNPDLQLSILPPAGTCFATTTSALAFDKTIAQDQFFTFNPTDATHHLCSLQATSWPPPVTIPAYTAGKAT